MITLYGITHCDTVKKARTWLQYQHIDYHFHDFRRDGLDRRQVEDWLAEFGWETLINKRGTTWKRLDDSSKQSLTATTAVDLILNNPTLIKRPLLDTGNQKLLGFKTTDYQTLLL